jgi:uncharacterized protein YndB with AHSA1/START domain
VIRFSITIDIARAPADVFDYLVHLENTPDWNWAIESTHQITPGPINVGTRFRQTRSVPRQSVETLEITRLEPGRLIEVAGHLASVPARVSYEIAPHPSGTRLMNAIHLDPRGPLRVVAGLLSGRVRASVAQNLSVLRTVLEQAVR